MTEIRLDVDLRHPCDRVWRALTDRELIPDWFGPVENEPDHPGEFTIRLRGVDGISAPFVVQLIEYLPKDRIVTRWKGEQLHVRMTITLTPRPDGCRLTFEQHGFVGAQGTLRRRVLRAGYDRLLRDRLARLLDRMAEAEAADPPQPPPGTPTENGGTGRRAEDTPVIESTGPANRPRGVARVPRGHVGPPAEAADKQPGSAGSGGQTASEGLTGSEGLAGLRRAGGAGYEGLTDPAEPGMKG